MELMTAESATKRAARYQDPLDLLQRFAPVPLVRMLAVDDELVRIATNDETLFPDGAFAIKSQPDAVSVQWTLVRDFGNSAPLEAATELRIEQVVTVFFGPGCVIGADLALKTIAAFIGENVSEEQFRADIAPVLAELTAACRKADRETHEEHQLERGRV